MDDGELMRKVRAGDRAAFEELYRRHAQRVFAYLWRFTGDETAAADLRQDTFFRFWLARADWRDGGSVAAYLVQTARNLALNAQRSQRLRRHWDEEARTAPRPTSPAPDVLLLQHELTERVSRAVAALPERPREVFSLKRDADLSYAEIAELLEISPRTVEAHMRRALLMLRDSLADLRDPDDF
jgi:RNA polymerase sigma-70 factor (ECF subfamily)